PACRRHCRLARRSMPAACAAAVAVRPLRWSAPWAAVARPRRRRIAVSGWSRIRRASSRKAVKPESRVYGKSCGSLAHLPRPGDRVDVDAEGIGAQTLGSARRLEHDGQDGGPSLGGGKLAVLVVPFGPGDAEAVRGRPDDARHLDGDLAPADAGEGVVGPRIIVQGRRAPVGGELIGAKPVLADDD